MKTKTTFLKAVLVGLVLQCSSLLSAETLKPEVEVTHWWNQPGELLALDEIKQAVIARGANFVDSPIESWDLLRSSVISRISMGYPPAVTQWLADDDIFGLNKMNAIYSTPSQWRGESLKNILFDEVYASLSKADKLVGLPLGIHVQNAALFNAAIYKELKLELPQSWSEVLEQAPIISQAGYIPVALSNEIWQLHMVLNTILLEALGSQNYQQLYIKGQSIKAWRKPLEKSFQTLIDLRKFVDVAARKRSWGDSVRMIGDGKAAMHVMGDFAKGELTAKGLVAGEDFLCSLAPGSNGHVIYAIDSFIMLNIKEPHLKKGQEILFDVMMDPAVQAAYNHKKGSIPVRRGVDLSQLDSCARETYQKWVQPSRKVTRFSGIANPLRTSFFSVILEKFWNEEEITAAQLADELITMDEAAL